MEKEFNDKKIDFNSGVFKIIKGILVAFIMTMILLFVFACVLVYTDVSESTIKPVVIVVTGLCIMIGGFVSSVKIKKRGILNGISVGLIYSFIIYILSSIMITGFEINVYTAVLIVSSSTMGAIGGIIGVNIN